MVEIAGPREESLVGAATLFASRRRAHLRIEGVNDSADPDHQLYESGTLLPSDGTILAGPTFPAWPESTS